VRLSGHASFALNERRITTVVPVISLPKMATFALFADPEGHVVGLVAREAPE